MDFHTIFAWANLAAASCKDLLTVVGASFGAVGGLFGLWRYKVGQDWERMKYVAEQVKVFDSDSSVARVKRMLDWEAETITFPSGTIALSRACAAHALRFFEQLDQLTPVEVDVRADFDAFFDYLIRFQGLVEAGLINHRMFEPYIGYWLDILSHDRGMTKTADIL